ncbi:hypothetical protein NL676_000277 [Syzygium grande]|nr:hypothetical protein NL676_000277 [Syzygium grande]
MASSIYVVEIIPIEAWDLEDVISPRGTLSASAEVWAGPSHACPARAWCQTLALRVLLPPGFPVEDAVLHVHVVHAVPEDCTRRLIGSAALGLCFALGDSYGYSSGGRASEWILPLRRPFGGPQGKVHVKLVVKEMRYRAPPTAYGVLPPPARRDYAAPPPPSYGQVENFGGTLTVFAAGAAAGVFTGLALAKGFDYLVDKITDVGKKLKGLFASGDVAEAAVDEGAGDASGDDDAEAAGDGDAGDADDLAFEELLTSDDDSEAAEDRDAGDAYGLAFEELLDSDDDSEDEDAEDASEDEDDPAPEIIDLTYPDDGGGGCGFGDDGGGVGDDNN